MTVATLLWFSARGLPKPQGSKVAFINRATGHAGMKESNERAQRTWRSIVSDAAQQAMNGRPVIEGPLRVHITFALPRPKSHPKTRTTWPITRPDIDKLARSILDSCTHVVWRDDSQVVALLLEKVWAEIDVPQSPGVLVTVSDETLVRSDL